MCSVTYLAKFLNLSKITFVCVTVLLKLPKCFYFSFRLLEHFCLSETALKLDTLVGDIEDAVSSTMKTSLRTRSTQNSKVSIFLTVHKIKITYLQTDFHLSSFLIMTGNPSTSHQITETDRRSSRFS